MPRDRRTSQLLTRFLAVFACLVFVSSLRDARLAPGPTRGPGPAPMQPSDRSATLRVTIVRAGEVVVDGATVQVFWEHAGRYYLVAAASSDRDGLAVLAALPAGHVWVLAEAAGLARASSSLVLSGTRELRMVLAPAEALAVTVQDETSAPLARATVLVESADPLPFGALTDEQGVAHFTRLPSAPWSVKASAPGFESVSKSDVRSALTLSLRKLASIEVSVRNADGSVASGATVMIAGATLWPARSATSDAKGVTKIAGLLAGSYDLRAVLGSSVSETRFGFDLARGANEQVALRLGPGRTVVALVTDGAGPSPVVVPNADVVLAEGGVSSFPIRGRTRSDGTVALGPIAPGPATLGARAPNFVGSALVAVPEVLAGPVRVALTRGGTLTGEVDDARGFPIEGATIEIVGTDPSGLPIAETPTLVGFRQSHFAWALPGPVPLIPAGELGVMPGPVPPIPRPGATSEVASNAVDFSEPLADLPPWITGGGGRFSARPITPGRVRAIVRHPDYVDGASELVTVAAGGEASVKIVLLRGGSLDGHVADEHGDPVSGAQVELSSPSATRTELTTTASDGTFAFAVVPNDVTLSLTRPDDASRVVLRKSLNVAEGAHETVELVLPSVRDPVNIVVLDQDRNPIEMVEVNATSLEPTRPLRLTRFTDAEGVASIDDAAGENLRLIAQAPGYTRVSKTFATTPKDVTLTLERGVLVTGRITAVRGRQNVENAVVTLQQDGLRQSATTNADGVYQLRDIAPGEVKLRVSQPDFADEEATARVEATGRADRAFSLPDIDLSEAGEVEGDVVDQEGNGVAGARVMAGELPSDVPVGKLQRGVALTDQDGHFTLGGVHPGKALISAISGVSGRGRTHADVSSGRTTSSLRIELAPPGNSEAEPIAPGGVAVTLGERGSAAQRQVVIVSVAAGSDAEQAGVQADDVVSAVDGARPSTMADARLKLSGQPGSDLVLEVQRAGAPLRFRLLREVVQR